MQKPGINAAHLLTQTQQLSERRIGEVKAHLSGKDELENADKTSVFHHILQSNLPQSEKEPARLESEAFGLLAAGTITTASTLSLITYYVLANPTIEKKLREELKDVTAAYPGQVPRWTDLEKVPYLTGCIKEGLRFVSNVCLR